MGGGWYMFRCFFLYYLIFRLRLEFYRIKEMNNLIIGRICVNLKGSLNCFFNIDNLIIRKVMKWIK